MAETQLISGVYDELIKKFLSDKKVLIADTSVAVRSGLTKVLKELGAKTANIATAQNYENAVQEMTERQPQIIIADYNMGNHCGLKLLHLQRRDVGTLSECIFFLITANSGETTVAEAAEEDVDCFILKPFALTFFRERFQQSVMAKLRPSGYQKALAEGKDLLKAKEFDKAHEVFSNATGLFSKPTMAHYYKGHTNALRKNPVAAEGSYREGLGYNKKHYRCLSGLSDLLFQAEKYEEAYVCAKEMAETFPLSPQMLVTVLRLAVKNQIFDDIDFLYSIYVSMDFRTPDLVKCMRSALLVSGAYRLRHSKVESAIDVLRKAMIVAARHPTIFTEIVDVLLRYGLPEEAEKFLREFPPEEQKSLQFQILRLRVQDVGAQAGPILEIARKLLAGGAQDSHLYEILIRRSVECGFQDSAESLAQDAAKIWPDKKSDFLGLLKSSQGALVK